MTASISYGNFNFKFDKNETDTYPVPKVNWGLQKNRTNAGDLLSEEINVTLDGVVAVSGDPDDRISILFERAKNLQDNIRNNDGKGFYFYFLGRPMVTGFGVVRNINFKENDNYWTNYIDYTIEIAIPVTGTGSLLIGDNLDTKHITSCEDSYTFTENPELYPYSSFEDGQFYHLYQLTRNLSATAKAYENTTSGALTYAKRWINLRETEYPLTGFFPFDTYKLYDRKREENFSETDGNYTIRDTFLIKSGEPWIYQKKISAGYDNNFLRTVSIQGEIRGLELATGIYEPDYTSSHVSGQLDLDAFEPYQDYTKNDVSKVNSDYMATKYENAVSGYLKIKDTFFDEVLKYDQFSKNLIPTEKRSLTLPLHAIPISVEEGLDPQNGKITFNRTYNSRPTGLLKGSLFESLSVNDSKPKTLVTAITVIGRRLGPLYYNPQGFGSTNNFVSGVGNRTVTYEAFFPRPTELKKYRFPDEIVDKIDDYLYLYAPSSPYNGFVVEDSQNLDLTENKITKTIVWEYIECNP